MKLFFFNMFNIFILLIEFKYVLEKCVYVRIYLVMWLIKSWFFKVRVDIVILSLKFLVKFRRKI